MDTFRYFTDLHGEPEDAHEYIQYAISHEESRTVPYFYGDEAIGRRLPRLRRKKKTEQSDSASASSSSSAETKTSTNSNTKKDKQDDSASGSSESDIEAKKARLRDSASMSIGRMRQLVDVLINNEFLGKVEWVQSFNDKTYRRYLEYTQKAHLWLDGFQPTVIPEEWWDVIVGELFYRVDNFVFPLSAYDVRLWFEWLTNWLTTEVADKLRERDMNLATVFAEDFQKFALAWGPALETALAGTPALVQMVAAKLCKELIMIIIRLVKNIVYLVIGIIIRVLKSIPYTCWLGYILGIVFSVVQVFVNAVI